MSVTEALAVLVPIAEIWAPDLLGSTPLNRAQVLEALSELTGEMCPTFAPLHVPGRYVVDAGAEASAKAAARMRVRDHFDRGDAHPDGRDWIVGPGRGRRSVAEAYLFAMCRWAGTIEAEIGDWSATARVHAAMRDDPGVRAALDAEGLDRSHRGVIR